jgi:hemolysin activation/secretion protein
MSVLCALGIAGWLPLAGQPASITLDVVLLDAATEALPRRLPWPEAAYPDSTAALEALGRLITALHEEAFLEAGVDTLVGRASGYAALLHVGPRYAWLALHPGNAPPGWLEQAGYRERRFLDQPLQWGQWLALRDQLARIAANNGYPFARARLKAAQLRAPGQLEAAIELQKGPLVRLESLKLEGESPLQLAYLYAYLGIEPGEPYQEDKVRRVRDRLRELPFVQLQRDPQVVFTGETAVIELYLAPKPASRFDFIIGVLPNSAQTGRLLLTGQLEGEVQNTFGRGERLAIRFEQPRPQTQELSLAAGYPYLLGTPFGVDAAFSLYRRDTNFLNTDWRAGLSYLLAGGDYFQAFAGAQATTLLGVDSAALARLGRLPDTLDVRRSAFGLEYALRRLDYRFNPRQGWSLWLRGSAGLRNIRTNNRIVGFGFEALYDALELRATQFRLEADAAVYWPLGLRGVVKLGLRGGSVLSRAPTLANEQFRIGGARLLRGFDEQSIFARHFAIGTLEYRFLLGQNAYFFLFADQAAVDARSAGRPDVPLDYPLGLGAGISFETRAGVFGLSLALGRRDGLPLDPGAPKVHLGYVSLF